MKSQKVFFGIFAAIGLPCLLLAAFFTYSTIQKLNSWETADGAITGFAQSSPYVSFDYKGKAYEFVSSYTDSEMRNGDAVNVYFPPNKPEEAEIKSFFTNWFLPLFLSLFGLVFGSVGVIGLVIQKRKSDAKIELFDQRRGKKIASPASVELDPSYTVNGRNPYVIRAQWLDSTSNTMHTFTSEHIWFDPSPFVVNKQIDVYIDAQNPKRYYVDITFLPKSAN